MVESSEPVPEPDGLDEQRSAEPEPQRVPRSADPEVPDADALDQATEIVPGVRIEAELTSKEANEADVWEQAQEVPLDDEQRATSE